MRLQGAEAAALSVLDTVAARIRAHRPRRPAVLAPVVVPPGVRRVADLPYGDPAAGQVLDLYLPQERPVAPSPLVIWSHGSAFLDPIGRLETELVAAALVPRGYAVAGVEIRTSRQATFPAQAHDVHAAVRYLRARAVELGVDPERFAAMGESSGGWAASMAGLTSGVPGLEHEEGASPAVSSAVQAVVAFYPPTDFATMDAQALAPDRRARHDGPRSPEAALLGGRVTRLPELAADASPARHAARHAAVPPFLILHGRLDAQVPYGQSRQLFDALAGRGAEATLVTVPRGEHAQWLRYLTDPALTAGATAETVTPDGVVSAPATPGWGLVAGFLATALTPSVRA